MSIARDLLNLMR